jgi:uncharacterized cupin superfamily protein
MDDVSEVFLSFEHPGTEFIYLLEGKIEYRHGKQTYVLEPGDALTFRGDVPHGPERLIRTPIHLLSVIVYGPEDQALTTQPRRLDAWLTSKSTRTHPRSQCPLR